LQYCKKKGVNNEYRLNSYVGCHTRSRVLDWLSNGEKQTMKCLEATDSNGTELYIFQLESNIFISVPKKQLQFKPLSPEEIKEKMGESNDS
jgi:hypothetical protein